VKHAALVEIEPTTFRS